MMKIDIKKINIFTVISILLLLGGLIHYIYWGSRYGIWFDVGIYSITIVLVIAGIIGILLTLLYSNKKD